MKRALVLLLGLVAILAAAEAWLRTGGAALASGALGSPTPTSIPSPDTPRAAPLLVVGSPFTAGAGLRDDERWTARLAKRVVGADSFSEVLVVAPVAYPPDTLLASLDTFARSGAFKGTAAIAPHERGADVVVIEAGGDALGADPTPFVIEPAASIDAGFQAAQRERGRLALLRALDGLRDAREHDRAERAVAELVATDGLVAGASDRARRRMDALTTAVRTRAPTPEQAVFLRALIGEIHGLDRRATRERKVEEWQRLLGTLRMEQRGVVVVLTGPALTTLALESLASDLVIPVFRAPPSELDPRLRTGPDGGAAAAVHAALADMVWVALSRKQMVPEPMAAPRDASDEFDRIESAAHSRMGIDETLVQLVHSWLTSRCDFDDEPPPQALRGVGRHGRLAPGVAAEVVLARPPLAEELVVHATVRSGALPRLALRHALGSATLEAKAAGPARGDPTRTRLEYRIAAPRSQDVVAWPAYEFTLEKGGDDPELELADVLLTAPTEADPPR